MIEKDKKIEDNNPKRKRDISNSSDNTDDNVQSEDQEESLKNLENL